MWATARTEAKRDFARSLGADEAFEPGARLPERVDLVVETVGEATWSHSLKSLRPGGTVVVCGATSGRQPARRPQPGVLPAAAGHRLHDGHQEPGSHALMERAGVRPRIDRVVGFDALPDAMAALAAGEVLGKVAALRVSRAAPRGCSSAPTGWSA